MNHFELMIRRSRQAPAPAIPTDYVFYVPLSSDYNDHSTYSRSMSYYGNQPTFTQIESIPCATFDGSSGIYTYDATDVHTGEYDRTVSGWVKLTNLTQTWPSLLFYGYPSTQQDFHVTLYNGGIMGCSWNVATSPTFPADNDWHHYLIRYTASTHTLEFFTDNTLISSTVVSNGVNFPSSNIGLSVCCTPNGNDKANTSSYAGVRFYDRALTDSEIALLASEFTPLRTIGFDNQHATFISETSATKQLATDPNGCTFCTSDTLPTGVTLASDGTLSFNGSVISQDSTTTISVTASKTGYASTTATITLKMLVEKPAIPEEEYLVIDAELATDTTPTVGTFYSKGSAYTFTTLDGVATMQSTEGDYTTGVWYTPLRSITGAAPRTLSLWLYPTNYYYIENWIFSGGGRNMGDIVCMTARSDRQKLHFAWGEGWQGALNQIAYPPLNQWTHVVFTYDGSYGKVYYNGVLMGTSNSGTLSTTNTNFSITGGDVTWGCCFRNYKVWDTALSTDEVSDLYDTELSSIFDDSSSSSSSSDSSDSSDSSSSSESSDSSSSSAPTIPTDYVFYAPLHENLNDISQYARTMTSDGTATFDTVDGLPCVTLSDWSCLRSYDMSGIPTGDHDFTLAVWVRSEYPSSYNGYGIPIGIGTNSSYQSFCAIINDYQYESGMWDYHEYTGVKAFVSDWTHVLVRYVASTHTFALYINGYQRSSQQYSWGLDIPSSGGCICISGMNGDWTNGWYPCYCDAYVYDRALTDVEIGALASQHSISYACSIDETKYMEFFPSYNEYEFSYVSVNEPTFEIISGSLPSTITLDTHTGVFSGTAPLDADHTYNLTVRLSAPDSTPATCAVTINTYATSRIWFSDQSFSYVRDGSESQEINVYGDEDVALAVESGYTLPSGMTISGHNLVCDGTTTAGTYTVVLRATSTHNQTGVTATMTINVNANVISINTNPIVFYVSKGAYSKPLKYTTTKHTITPVYTLTGTLPAGITFNSQTGILTSDGTQIADESATVSVTVASSTGLSTPDTENVPIEVEMVAPAVPDDYIWYTPFTTDYEEETSGIVGVPYQQNAFSIATDNSKFGTGYLAARKTNSDEYGIEYPNTATYMDLSGGEITISLWLRAPDWSQHSQLLGGTRPGDGSDGFVLFADFEWQGVLDFRSATNDSLASPQVNVDSDWHHWLFTRTAQGVWTWYKDGVASTSGTGDTGSINGYEQNMKIGGGFNWSKEAYFDLAHFRVYDRVLDATEIGELYHEFG